MVHKKISADELNELVEMGSEVEFEKDSVTVPGLSELILKLTEIIKANEALSKSNEALASSQQQQTRALLTAVIEELSSNRQSVDTKPIAKAISNIQPQIIQQSARSFTFEIERDQRGRMIKVEAIPKQETIN